MEFTSVFGRFTFRNLNALSDQDQENAFKRLMSHYEKQENAELLHNLSDYALDLSVTNCMSFTDIAELSKFFTKAMEYGEGITYFELHGMLFFFCNSVTNTLNHLALGYFGVP